ncbi:MAG: hypothetical protein PHU33_15935 [Bacteroidales bacterium]|nr:hypothetical protein [Bacteroidales bacterium]
MAKFSEAEKRIKIQYAKDLYIKGFEYPTISEILGVGIRTLEQWGRENQFEEARQTAVIALSEIRATILQSFSDLKAGKTPAIKPDEASKYAAAFEKLSDRRKTLTYMYEAFEMLTTELTKDVQLEKGKQREMALQTLKIVREKMDKLITRLTNDVLTFE